MTSYSLTILLTSILFCTISVVLGIMLNRANNKQKKLRTEMQAILETLQNNVADHEGQKENHAEENIFNDTLRTAELTTRLQQPHLKMLQRDSSPSTPERYLYIQSMVEKGMSSQEIASILSMSLHETSQLVNLIRLACQHHQPCSEQQLPTQETTPDNQNIHSTTLDQPSKQYVHTLAVPARIPVTVNKSFKLARWLKGRALAPYLRKQSSREPPPHPLPRDQGIPYHPLPA